MSDDIEEGNFGTTSHIAELEINWKYYGRFVNGVEYKLKIEDVKEDVDVKKSGIYKLIPENRLEIYVGEAQYIFKRLNDYTNAGYVPNAKREYTNRRIQGWMYDLNKLKNEGGVKIFVCTEAFIRRSDETKQKLDLDQKHNRLLIENLEISITPNDFEIQNFSENWARNKNLKSINTE